MAVGHPMENYNRKNPYVISAKKCYNELMDAYSKLSKTVIVLMVVLSITFIMTLSISIWYLVTTHSIWKFLILLCVVIGNLIYGIYSTWKMLSLTIKHPLNKEIEKILTFDVNNFSLDINDEKVNNTIHQIHRLMGYTESMIYNYKSLLFFISIENLLIGIIICL